MPDIQLRPFLASDDSLLGTLSEATNYQYHGWVTSGWSAAEELLGSPIVPSRTDRMFLRVTPSVSAGTPDRIEIDLPAWLLLPEASSGDALTGTNSLTYSDGVSAGAIRVGRSSHNRVLLAPAGFTTTSPSIQGAVDIEYYVGGVLGRKLDVLQQHNARRIVLHIRSASRPANPVGASYDGSVINAGTNGYRTIDVELPAGTDPTWLAEAEALYNAITGLWTIASWTVYAIDSTFNVQYAPEDTNPDSSAWSATPPADTDYYEIRWRLPDGTWRYGTVGTPPANRRWIISQGYPNGGTTGPHTHPFYEGEADFASARILRITWTGRKANGTWYDVVREQIFPAGSIWTCDPDGDARQRQSVNLGLAEWDQPYNTGSESNLAGFNTNEHRQRLQLNFIHRTHREAGRQLADAVIVRLGQTTFGGLLTMQIYG